MPWPRWRAAAPAAAALFLLPACVPAQAGSQAAPAAAALAGYTMRVAPFPVAAVDGTALAHPFLGGFDVPRPQLADVDGDGDMDLFVQERSGELIYFERDGGAWHWRTDRFQDLDIGEWYRFVDLDGDGDLDLLGEWPYSYVRAWRNEGSRGSPRFVPAADSLRGADGVPIFADRQNILNLADIDCNGRLDLFLGRVTGTVDRFEAEPVLGPSGLPQFRLVTERWEGIEIIGPVPGQPAGPLAPGPTMHGANTMAFGDPDGDGDLDLFWGDFFEQGLLLIRNDGGCPHFSLRGAPERFPTVADPLLTTGYNAPAPGDADGDGDMDLVVGVIGGAFNPVRSAADNLYLLEQRPDGFAVVTSRLVTMIDVGSESIPALADLDGDGDLDLLIGNKIAADGSGGSQVVRYENVGTTRAPAFIERGPLPLAGEYHLAPVVADLDGDGLDDLVLGGWRDVVQWWRNTGSREAPAWTLADSALVTITRGSNTVPTLGDLDSDGDLDLLVGESSGQLNLYRNTGSRTAPRFELVSDTFGDIDPGRRSAPALVDLDGDGRVELLLGSEEGMLELWRNASDGEAIRFVRDGALPQRLGGTLAPAAGDLDGDGDVDLVVGTAGGGLRYLEATGGR